MSYARPLAERHGTVGSKLLGMAAIVSDVAHDNWKSRTLDGIA